MTEFPIIPPDPTPEELAYQRRLAASFAELTDLTVEAAAAAGRNLTPEERRGLNDGARRMRESDETWAQQQDQLAGRKPRKPQRGKIPKRGARRRQIDRPKATLDDINDLERRLGLDQLARRFPSRPSS